MSNPEVHWRLLTVLDRANSFHEHQNGNIAKERIALSIYTQSLKHHSPDSHPLINRPVASFQQWTNMVNYRPMCIYVSIYKFTCIHDIRLFGNVAVSVIWTNYSFSNYDNIPISWKCISIWISMVEQGNSHSKRSWYVFFPNVLPDKMRRWCKLINLWKVN